jgi:hypothetical protein
MPLFQTNFLPDLIQVYVLFPTTDLLLIFVHLAPAFTAAFTGIGWKVSATHNIKMGKNLGFLIWFKVTYGPNQYPI